MKIQPDIVKLQEFQAQNKRDQIVQLDRMIHEFEQMIIAMEEQIVVESREFDNNQCEHFAHANFAKAARQRRENLRQSLDDLKKQRENVETELAEIEASRQTIAMRRNLFRQTSYSTRSIMV